MLLPNNRAESCAVNSVSLAFARIYDEKREESGLFEGSGTLLIPPPSYLCTMTMKPLLDSQISPCSSAFQIIDQAATFYFFPKER